MIKQYEELFYGFRELQNKIIQDTQPGRKTFMEISGYPHYENVVSNILSFLFDDSEEHGMGNLWLNALLAASDTNNTIRETHNISVEREVYTEKGNRIDLLVTSDDYMVCIENKIFSDVGNDLKDYKKTADNKNKKEGKEVICIVLSLKPAKYEETDIFKNVTYEQLFKEVRSNIGNYMDNCDNTWFMYIKDFVTTIESLNGGNMIDKQFEKFYQDNYNNINNFEDAKKNYLKGTKEEASKVNEILKSKLDQLKNETGFTHSINLRETPYSSESQMRSSVVLDFTLSTDGKKVVTIETSRDAWGWHIALHNRSGNETKDIFSKICSEINICSHSAQKDESNTAKEFYEGQYIIENIDDNCTEIIANVIVSFAKKMIKIFSKYTD